MSIHEQCLNAEAGRAILRRFINDQDVKRDGLARAMAAVSLQSLPVNTELIWQALRKDKLLLRRFGSDWIDSMVARFTELATPASEKTLGLLISGLEPQDLSFKRWRAALLKLARSKEESPQEAILFAFTKKTDHDPDLGFTVSHRGSYSRNRRSARTEYPQHLLREFGNGQCHPIQELRGTYLYGQGTYSAKPRLVLVEYGGNLFWGPDLLDDIANHIDQHVRPRKSPDYCKALEKAVDYLAGYVGPARSFAPRSSQGTSTPTVPDPLSCRFGRILEVTSRV